MNGPASFTIATAETAAQAMEYFNGFHDGFMQRIVLESQDRILDDRSQTCSGRFDVTIDFAHYNYPDAGNPFHPHDQIVRAKFCNVQDIVLDLGAGFLGNTILALTILPAVRRKGGQTGMEECLALHLTRHFYVPQEARYDLKESQLFTFTNAMFTEMIST